MSGATHTPGPWASGRPYTHTNNQAGLRITGADGFVVVTGFCQSDEDLRLIAAAPELLDALIDFVEVAYRDLNGLAAIQPELKKARAAIAKATGRPA